MKLTLRDLKGNAQGEMELPFSILTNGRGSQALHDTVVAYRAAKRSGTACTKTMGEVAGTGKKPWRQKGTGRARAGSFASPLWRGGGVVFGPKPRDFSKKVNRSTRSLAFLRALSDRLREGDVIIVEQFDLNAPKTKEFVAALSALKVAGTALVVAAAGDRHVQLAARNVPGVEVVTADSLNSYQILRYDKILVSKAALETLGTRINRG